jgi:Nif-specific regulatory protein
MVGDSEAMRNVKQRIAKVARGMAPVLVHGESGTGKELVARAIHSQSNRATAPFIPVNCAAISKELIESELFGHEKGSFTGAMNARKGAFEEADGGTIFLDEIGELPIDLQAKLLRALESGEIKRVGAPRPITVDVRIVAATNRDLLAMSREGKFREDLYYRIKVVELGLPPLRARGPEDVERLARHFIAQATRRHHLSREPHLSSEALERLKTWHWPGNVRELENCVESAVVLCEGDVLPEHLPLPESGQSLAPVLTPAPSKDGPIATLADVERRHILNVLERAKGNRTQAAKWLAIGRNTLARKLKEYGLAEE